MEIFSPDKKLVVIYLSKTGCLDYTKEMLRGFKKLDPLLVIASRNTKSFSDFQQTIFKTKESYFFEILAFIGLQSRVNKLLDRLEREHGPLHLYFPAFHHWNHYFVKWSARNKASTSILTVHDFVTHQGESSKLVEKLQRKSMALATRVICLSEYVRAQLIAELAYAEKCLVVPHPLVPAPTINKLQHSAKPNILFLGRIVAYKGVHNLITAVKDLDIGKLTIAGQLSQKLGPLPDKVQLIDRYLTDEETTTLLETHHILVLPYLEASQSGILILGLASEMVMVISKVGGLQEQLPAEAALWIEPNAASIKQAIQTLQENPQRYQQLKQAVKKYKSKLSDQV